MKQDKATVFLFHYFRRLDSVSLTPILLWTRGNEVPGFILDIFRLPSGRLSSTTSSVSGLSVHAVTLHSALFFIYFLLFCALGFPNQL